MHDQVAVQIFQVQMLSIICPPTFYTKVKYFWAFHDLMKDLSLGIPSDSSSITLPCPCIYYTAIYTMTSVIVPCM